MSSILLPFHLEDFFLNSFICTTSVFLFWVTCRDFFTAVQSFMKYCFNELVYLQYPLYVGTYLEFCLSSHLYLMTGKTYL